MSDMIMHPEHYQGEFGMEVIDVIENFTANLTGIEATDTGNIIKYACRWKKKNGVEDLEKIKWYCDHLINYLAKQDLIAKVRDERMPEERMKNTKPEYVPLTQSPHVELYSSNGEVELDSAIFDEGGCDNV
jgi:hypothetical protein